jgi:hypothetical protein
MQYERYTKYYADVKWCGDGSGVDYMKETKCKCDN